jgi:hypothetical protein
LQQGSSEAIRAIKIIAACALFIWARSRRDHKKARKPGF